MGDYNQERSKNYHSSSIRTYFECPKKFILEREHKIEKEPTRAMQLGLLLEGYIFGFKDQPEYSEFNIRGLKYNKDGISIAKNKGLQDVTVAPIKKRAEFFKQFFGEGEAFVKIEYDGNYKNAEKLRGETDFIGEHWIDKSIIPDLKPSEKTDFLADKEMVKRRVMVDLKDTVDIYYRWHITNVMQVLQSVLYPYIWMQATGEVIDFVYFIAWNKTQTVFKQIYSKTTKETFLLAEKLVDKIDTDLFFEPDVEVSNCIGGGFTAGCDYVELCEEGRAFVAQSGLVYHSELDIPGGV
jgi:hypothetical protein